MQNVLRVVGQRRGNGHIYCGYDVAMCGYYIWRFQSVVWSL